VSYLIEMRETGRGERTLWAQRTQCSKKEAVRSAEGLLADLREKDPRAMVWLDGRRIRLPRKKEGV
jgi:hypothetical protein